MADESTTKDKIYLCKYKVETLVLMKGEEKIELDHSNILNVEYMNDYEFNLRAIIKIRLRMDVRKRLWVLKNKKEIICKFELNKFGMDPEVEEIITGIENVWNQEFSIYLNDEDDSNDVEVMEQRIKKNEGDEFKNNDLKDENYFESQNTFDIYLFNQTLLNASQKIFNHVFTKNTLQQMVGRMLTETKHDKVLMSKFENNEIYSELLVPAHPLYKDLIYLDQYYGFYKKGAIIYYDWDVLYLLNGNGKITAKRENEWVETIFMVTKLDESTPGNGMIRKEGEKKFYIGITDMNINPKKFTIGHNIDIGSEAKVIITDDTEIEIDEADQSYIDQRNEFITFRRKDENKYIAEILRARMEENECILYINAENLDINAFTPNKQYSVVFDEPTKQKKFGKYKYRVTYAYHMMKLESEGFMASSHMIMLKRIPED